MTPSGCCTRYYSTWKSTIGCCRSCDVDALSHKSTIDIHSRDSHFTQEMAWWWRRMMMGGPRGGGGVWRRNTFEWCIPRDSTKLFMTVDKICIIRYEEHASPDCKRRVNALITLSARCLVCRENSTPTHPPTPTHTHTRNITICNMWEDKKITTTTQLSVIHPLLLTRARWWAGSCYGSVWTFCFCTCPTGRTLSPPPRCHWSSCL